jgi:hypothetical protein
MRRACANQQGRPFGAWYNPWHCRARPDDRGTHVLHSELCPPTRIPASFSPARPDHIVDIVGPRNARAWEHISAFPHFRISVFPPPVGSKARAARKIGCSLKWAVGRFFGRTRMFSLGESLVCASRLNRKGYRTFRRVRGSFGARKTSSRSRFA